MFISIMEEKGELARRYFRYHEFSLPATIYNLHIFGKFYKITNSETKFKSQKCSEFVKKLTEKN